MIIAPYVLEETDAECITFGGDLFDATNGMYASGFSSGAFFCRFVYLINVSTCPDCPGRWGEFPFLPWEKDAPAAWIVCEAGVRHPLEPYIRQKGRGISINHE
ncbi:hypothetical protein ADH72_01890 [Akkermansia muciniphila]|nr:hypothetical protein A4V05_06170 [Akkermansia muciniphila]ASB34537.1 hypothetical protein ADH72_01890 [Akkermansia muciniphila]